MFVLTLHLSSEPRKNPGHIVEEDSMRLNVSDQRVNTHMPMVGSYPPRQCLHSVSFQAMALQPLSLNLHTVDRIDINTAGFDTLTRLPGIGSVLAQRIIDFRFEYGPFADVALLQCIRGIGPKRFATIQPYIFLSDS